MTDAVFGLVDSKVEQDVIGYMSKATGVKYSDEQLNILKTHGGMCILASAGSGKTTTLNHLIAKRIQTGEIGDPSKLLCTTFSKAGADEMGQRLDQLLSQLGIHKNVKVRTLHSTYLSILRDLQYNFKVIEDGQKLGIIREACKDLGVNLEDDELLTLASVLSFQVNNLMSDADVFMSYVYTIRDKVDKDTYSKIRASVNEKKQSKGLVDFDDMQLLVYQIFRSNVYGKALEKYCQSLWEYIYIDEAQDISKIQFAILKKMVGDPNKLVIIGDDDQCIYEWRCADPSIILNICGIYPELTRVTLTTNYRCLSNIVDRAAHGIKFNQIRSDKSMVAYDKGGDIKFCDTGDSNMYTMSKYAFKYIRDLIVNDGVNPSDIAVLARNNSHLSILGNMLFRNGIFCRMTEDIKLTKQFRYKQLASAIVMADNTTNSQLVSKDFWMFCAYLNKRMSNEIGKIQSTYGLTLKDTLGLILTEFLHVKVDWQNPGIKIGALDFGKYNNLFNSLKGDTIGSLVTIFGALNDNNPAETAITLMKMFIATKKDMYFKSESAFRFGSGLVEYLTDLLRSLGFAGYKRFIKTVEQFEAGEMAVMSPMVTLSTMHGAKGKEWRYVLMFAVDNVSFPDFNNIDNCMAIGIPELDIRRMIDEDRRLHYVAMTRAKEHLSIFANKENLSVYTLESFGVADYGTNSDKHIMAMAQHGLYNNLVNGSIGLFTSAETMLDVKIDDIDKTKIVGQHSLAKDDDEAVVANKSSFNLNSIQTYAAIQGGED